MSIFPFVTDFMSISTVISGKKSFLESTSPNFKMTFTFMLYLFGRVGRMPLAWLYRYRNCQLNLFPMCWDLILNPVLIIQAVSKPKAEKSCVMVSVRTESTPRFSVENSELKPCRCFYLLASAVKHQLSSDSNKYRWKKRWQGSRFTLLYTIHCEKQQPVNIKLVYMHLGDVSVPVLVRRMMNNQLLL